MVQYLLKCVCDFANIFLHMENLIACSTPTTDVRLSCMHGCPACASVSPRISLDASCQKEFCVPAHHRRILDVCKSRKVSLGYLFDEMIFKQEFFVLVALLAVHAIHGQRLGPTSSPQTPGVSQLYRIQNGTCYGAGHFQ